MPRIGIALSGEGYRAMLNGAGALAAFDDRTSGSTEPGQLGGILQASPATLSIRGYYQQLQDAVEAKANAGYNTTITEYWGRALSYQLFNATDGAPAYTFSSIATDTSFTDATIPMPIVVALERPPGQIHIWENSTVFEFNPWEMGSYDPGNPAFVSLRYVGSAFANGTLSPESQCIADVDNVGFIVGTSSSPFNQAFLQIGRVSSEIPDFFIRSINATLARISEENSYIASWPNPFYRYRPEINHNANFPTLDLVDGGEDLQNIPFHPLLWSRRAIDVILAVDSSADTITHWPNGTSLVATYQRFISGYYDTPETERFPPVPEQNTFVNLGLNRRPTFFGCHPDNVNPGPIIVYLPNAPYSSYSNVTTFQLEYTTEERQAIIRNGYDVATMANATVDAQWPTCLGCAILERSLRRTERQAPEICGECFERYCWNGTVNETNLTTYDPSQIVVPSGGKRRGILSVGVGLVVGGLYLGVWFVGYL
ncbi:Lysophospholipase 2 [Madurella mycetomatis]|uniref:Lysophospholipase n=1 Tax=Madurella mycetomatis TaxID=100816 RepID=A0A175VW42_9PEZI|nr:Lysophospholipase 2 [Madurella mycetomatis]